MVKLLKALLARACIPFCLLQVLRFESDQLLYTDIIFLCIWITFTSVCIYEATYGNQSYNDGGVTKLIKHCLYIVWLILSYSFIHRLFMDRCELRKHLMMDHGFPHLNFKQVLDWLCYEVWSMCWFLYHFMKAFGILRPVRLIGYFLYLALNAMVLTFVLEYLLYVLYVQVYFNLRENFFYTFDVNNTDAYPKGYLDPHMVDHTLYEKTTIQKEFFSCNPYVIDPLNVFDEHVTCTQPISIKSYNKQELPFQHESIYRYVGEDVEMECSYKRKYTHGSKSLNDAVWYFNETLVKKSSRHRIDNNYRWEGEWKIVTSVLTIKHVKEDDFGEYVCTDTFKDSKLLLNEFGRLKEDRSILKISINVFNLIQLKMQPKILKKIVGNLIASENFFWFQSDTDVSDISIRYTINGRPVDEVCPGFQTQVCSVGASILRNFIRVGAANFDWDGVESFPYLDVAQLFPGFNRGIIYFCLCSNGYGVHKLSFLTEVHKVNTKSQTYEEFVHPFVFIVLPLASLSLFRYFDDTHLYESIEKLINEETKIDVIEYEVQQHLIFIAANEEKIFTEANIIQSILHILFLIFMYISTVGLSMVYYNFFIVMPARTYFFMPALPEKPPIPAIEEETFDVFLSYEDKEYDFVSEKIVPFLEGECNLRVCLASRDIPPNRSIFCSYVEKIRKCRKIIVIISQTYLAEPQCSKLQLEHIILPLYYDHSIAPHDLLLLRYDYSRLPDILRWNFDVDVLPWVKITQLPEPVLLQKLKLWLLTGRVSINCYR